MEHVKILGIKFIAISITVLSFFGIFNQTNLGDLILISVLTTIFSYLLGDMVILRKFGNAIASIADFGLSFVSYWVLASLFIEGSGPILVTSLIAAFFTACVEPFIHGYILNQFTDFRKREEHRPMNQLQTEFAEEMDIEKHKVKRDHQRKQDPDNRSTNFNKNGPLQ